MPPTAAAAVAAAELAVPPSTLHVVQDLQYAASLAAVPRHGRGGRRRDRSHPLYVRHDRHPQGSHALPPDDYLERGQYSDLAGDLRETDSTPTFAPFFHAGGLNVLTTPLLHCGGTVVAAAIRQTPATCSGRSRESEPALSSPFPLFFRS